MTLAQLARAVRSHVERAMLSRTSGEAGALFRIGFGLLVIYWLVVGIGWNLERYFGEAGLVPRSAWQAAGGTNLTLLALGPSRALLWGVWGAGVAAGLCFTLGFGTRVAAAVLYVATGSIYNRNPWLFNAGDHLVVVFCFLSVFAPLDLRWSIAAVRRARRGVAVEAPVFGLMVIKLLIVFVYLSSYAHKMGHSAWRHGEAVGVIMQSARFAGEPGILAGAEWLARLLTWATLVIEAAFPLVFVKKVRLFVLAAGVGLHLSIEALMRIPIFSAIMIVSYLALLDDDEARWFGTRLLRLPSRPNRGEPDPQPRPEGEVADPTSPAADSAAS